MLSRFILSGTVLGILVTWPNPADSRFPVEQSKRNQQLNLVQSTIDKQINELEELYRHLHAHPELSLQEEKTAARMAREIKDLGFEVTQNFGGHGVIGVLRNGKGPTVMVRTDMDALPVIERTGLPYASTVRAIDKQGNPVGVMHACGHDMHMSCWVGTAKNMVAMKDQWQGTLVMIAQPAEEIGSGARMMLQKGLFDQFPKPDYCLALHCDPLTETGSISYTEGIAMANVDSIELVINGKGGHGAMPQATVDPIVLAARVILDLQTLVSREITPTDPAVLTVGSIHGGTKHNIIPNEVKLQITLRTTKDSVRKHMIEGIERIAKAAALGARAPEPKMTVDSGELTPALVNNPELTRKTVDIFREILGEDKIHQRPVMMGGEDFSRYGKTGIPICLFFLGTISKERMMEANREGGKKLPSLHFDLYFPEVRTTIKTGTLTMSMAVLNLLGK